MKKALWIFVLIALTFVGDRVGGLLLKKLVDASQFRYSRMYAGTAQSDILLVGNSRGLIFYQPYIEEITGKKTFNISYNGMPINLARAVVEDYLEQYEKPSKLIIDVTMCDRMNNTLINGFNTYSPYSERLSNLIKTTDADGNMYEGALVSHLFRYNSEIFQRSLRYLKSSDEDWLLDRVINQFMQDDVSNQEPYTIGIEPPMIDDLAALAKVAQAKGVEIHLVINPYFPAFADKITNIAEMKSQIEKATGIKVKDYSKMVTNTEGFADYQHLNKLGSKVYLDRLKADGVL